MQADSIDEGSSDDGSRILAAYVAQHGIDAELINPGVAMPTVDRAAAALGVPPALVVKTIVFETKNSSHIGVAIVPGDVRVARHKVAAALQLKTLKLARPDVVKRATGYQVGGVPPIGHLERLPTVVHRDVLRHERVFGGGGDEHHMLRVNPADIVTLTGACIADVADVADVADGAERSDVANAANAADVTDSREGLA